MLFAFSYPGLWCQEEQAEIDALKTLTPGQLEERLKTTEGEDKFGVLLVLARNILDKSPGKSLDYAREALRLARQSGAPFYIASSLIGVGNYYHVKNRFQEAASYYLEALKLEPQIRDKNMVAKLYTNIGMIYWNLGQNKKAEEYQRLGLKVLKETKYSNSSMAFSLNNLGLALSGQGKAKEALEYFSQALALYREDGYKRGMAAALNNIASVNQDLLKDNTKALEYFLQTIPLYKEIEYEWGVANAFVNIAITYIHMSESRKAVDYLEKALEIAGKIRDQRLIFLIYENFSVVYENTGDYRTAMKYSKKYDQVNDDFFNRENSSRIDNLMIRYDAEKKENQIRLLRKMSEIRQIIRVFLLVALLSFLGVTVVLYSHHRTRIKINRLLEQGEARYRAMFDHAADAILLMENAAVVDYNNKALEMFGEDMEEIGKALEGRPPKFHWQHVKKDGTPFDAQVSTAPVIIQQRSLIQVIIHDITHRTRLEKERIKSARLETTQILAGGIAHDFNNLLAIILGYIELAQSELEPGNKTDLLFSKVKMIAQSAVELVDKFRSISEAGFLPQEVLPIADILRESVNPVMERSVSAGRDVECVTDISPDVPRIKGWRVQLRKVFENLLDNALEAMGDTGKIQIAAASVEKDGKHYALVTISDNGEGILPEHLHRVFEPYFTTRGNTTRKGRGMGLTVAESIVKRHNGTIDVSSDPGRGTTFQIYLPAVSTDINR